MRTGLDGYDKITHVLSCETWLLDSFFFAAHKLLTFLLIRNNSESFWWSDGYTNFDYSRVGQEPWAKEKNFFKKIE